MARWSTLGGILRNDPTTTGRKERYASRRSLYTSDKVRSDWWCAFGITLFPVPERIEEAESITSLRGSTMADYDSPWKEALELYFPAFLALFYPHIPADIDWSRGHVFLDKELQRILPKTGRGRQYVDKLVKVWRKNGREAWVLIHIEVQTQREAAFPRRMYGYNTRLTDRYNRTVVSLAVLADDDPNWRPDHFAEELWGWSLR